MHPSRADHLSLCSVPKRVVGLGVRELFFRVEMCAFIAGMLAEGAPRPRLDAFEGPEARIIADKIDRKLAPHDQLFEKGLAIADGCRRAMNRARHRMRSNLAEMKIRRELAGCVNFRMVTAAGIIVQTVANKSPKHHERRIRAAVELIGGTDGAIDMKPIREFPRNGKRLDSSITLPGNTHFAVSDRLKELLQAPLNTRTNRAGCELLIFE